MMAIAAWLVWKPTGLKGAATVLTLFGVQLVLNVVWSWIFFGLHQPGWAFVEIVILMGGHSVNDRRIRSPLYGCWLVNGAVSGLGQFCQCFELLNLAIEHRLTYASIRSVTANCTTSRRSTWTWLRD